MTVRSAQFKTVSADSASALDVALQAAKAEIVQRNEGAQFVDLVLSSAGTTLFATIVWSG